MAPDGPGEADIEASLERYRQDARRRLGTREDFKVPRAAAEASDDLGWAVIERIFNELATPYEPDPRYFALTEGQRALYALWWTEAEIANGGFHQFFSNSTGFFAADVPAAARLIGADRLAAISERANEVLTGSPLVDVPRERDARSELLEAVDDDAIDELDEPWYDAADGLHDLIERYIGDHPEDFFAP